jgi:hypothetical protein
MGWIDPSLPYPLVTLEEIEEKKRVQIFGLRQVEKWHSPQGWGVGAGRLETSYEFTWGEPGKLDERVGVQGIKQDERR